METVDLREELGKSDMVFPDVGPRGGDLLNPALDHQRRRAGLNATIVDGYIGLHRFDDVAARGLKDSKPWHRLAATMVAHGVPDSAIAKSAEVEVGMVYALKSQRWFQELVAVEVGQLAENLGAVMQAEALGAFERVVELSKMSPSEDVKASTILSANTFIVEQVNGKATQKVLSIVQNKPYENPSDEMRDLRSQIAALEERRVSSIPADGSAGVAHVHSGGEAYVNASLSFSTTNTSAEAQEKTGS